ncbi:MAG: gluconolactonase [Maribacter sp.]|jgi:gluconolactonase
MVADGYAFTEGPASDKEGTIFFTDQANNRILKWDAQRNTVSTYMSPAVRANGFYVNNKGNLLAAADEKYEHWLIDADKNMSILLHQFKNNKDNGPNAICVDQKGGIYFTDPYYQKPYWKHKEAELAVQSVYYIAPNGTDAKVIADNFKRPNGIIGPAEGSTLYIADKKTYSYTIETEGTLSNRQLFTQMGSDGMAIDNQDNVYLTGDGVFVFDSKGNQIEHIDTGADWTANVTFGGREQNMLFITTSKAVFTLKMSAEGVRW